MIQPLRLAGPVLGAALDLDGVLVDGMPFHYEAFAAALRDFGVDATIREVALLEGMRTREIIKRIANQHGVFPTDAELNDAEQRKRRIYSDIFRPRLMEGAAELVALLAQRGCRLAIVTGTAEASARAAIKELRSEDLFQVIISHDSAVPTKPHPAPYATAAELLLVPPENCIAVENAPPGVTSARAAGLRCLAVASYVETEDLSEADLVFPALPALNSWLVASLKDDGERGWFL